MLSHGYHSAGVQHRVARPQLSRRRRPGRWAVAGILPGSCVFFVAPCNKGVWSGVFFEAHAAAEMSGMMESVR